MYKITRKQILGTDIKRLDLKAENVSKKAKPGQFVTVMPDAYSERVPLSVMDTDPAKGLISLVVEERTASTKKLGEMQINESVHSLLGPLGTPLELGKVGTTVCIGSGVGIAQILPVCRALKKNGNKVIGAFGATTKKKVILEFQMRLSCNKIHLSTRDGSYESKGTVADSLKEILSREKARCVFAVAPVEELKDICSLTLPRKIKTMVCLQPVMVDGTGLCGSCRVKVAGKKMLACVDGPFFDGQFVDFEDLMIRMNAAKENDQWGDNASQSNSLKNGSKTLGKFLSDIIKNKP